MTLRNLGASDPLGTFGEPAMQTGKPLSHIASRRRQQIRCNQTGAISDRPEPLHLDTNVLLSRMICGVMGVEVVKLENETLCE